MPIGAVSGQPHNLMEPDMSEHLQNAFWDLQEGRCDTTS
jgi:hypothetical protein